MDLSTKHPHLAQYQLGVAEHKAENLRKFHSHEDSAHKEGDEDADK